MPAMVEKNPDGTYRVISPGGVHAKHTSRSRAYAQMRLLNMIDHGGKVWRRHGKKKRRLT